MIKITTLCILAIGCTEGPNELWIGSECPDGYKTEIRAAVDEVNQMCGEKLIVIAGETSARGQVGTLKQDNNAIDIAACVLSDDVAPVEGRIGEGGDSTDLIFWIDRIPGDRIPHTTRHEVGHYLGAGHLTGADVMNPRGAVAEYTDADIAEICH